MSQAESPKPSTPDLWARASTLISAITPIIVIIVGYVLNAKVNEANLRIAQQRGAFEELKARAEELKLKVDADSVATKSRIEKVDAVLKLLQELTGPSVERRRVAMEAVKIVLPPHEAISILTALNNSAVPGSKQAAEVKSVLDGERSRLIEGMFSYQSAARESSLRTLQQAWSSDDTIIRQLIARARTDLEERRRARFPAIPAAENLEYQRLASVSNTTVFLAGTNSSDTDLRRQIIEFASAAERNSAVTATHSTRIKIKYQQ